METGKLTMLEDWMSVRNAILRADSGEMKVTHRKNKKNEIIGVVVDMELNFPKALPQDFTEKERKAIKVAIQEMDNKLKEKQ